MLEPMSLRCETIAGRKLVMREEELEKLYDEYVAARTAFEDFRDTHGLGAATEPLDMEPPAGWPYEVLSRFKELNARMGEAKRRYDDASLQDP